MRPKSIAARSYLLAIGLFLMFNFVLTLLPSVSFGDVASYTFSAGFSSTQGANQWSYYQLQGSTYAPMTWDAANNVWRGGETGGYPMIWSGGGHPGNMSDAVIRWTATSSGTIQITGTVAKADIRCGDGIVASIVQNGTTLWSVTLDYGDTTGKSHSVAASVSPGDTIDFVINRRGEYSCDSTKWDPTITQAPQVTQISGALDGLTNTNAVGWALNSDNPSQAVSVRFYEDALPAQSGTYLGNVTPDQSRSDLGGNYGFNFPIPDQYLDGASHTVYAYGADAAGNLTPLQTSPKSATFACGLAHCPTISASSNNGHITIEPVGTAHYVFNNSTDGCSPNDGADSPARAFRDASGNVILTAANGGSTYRSVGPTLDTVKRACGSGPIMGTGNNPDYNAIIDHEWPTAPYSTDGTNVYALVHNEWHRPELLNPACTPGQAWVNSITLAVSNDGGLHFTHPADYKIRTPEPWNTSFLCASATSSTQMGSFEPTNIISKDGYYYSLFNYISAPVAPYTSGRGPNVGDCVMRTNDLSKASAWQVWTGADWSSARDTSACALVNTAGAVKSISYNTYLHSYIGVGDAYDGSGFAYTLSQDLIHWSPFVTFIAAPLPQGSAAYISLLDPTDTSRNFEQSGRTPYIYFTMLHGWPNYDIIRQQIKFTDLTPTPTCTPNWSCAGWNQCMVSGSQTRTCTDTNACGVTTGKPSETQSCTYSSGGGGGGSFIPVTVVASSTAPAATTSATTSTDTTTPKITALLAQIQQLQALIAKLTGGGSSSTTAASTAALAQPVTYNGTCPVLSRTLSIGSRGADVTALQEFFYSIYQNFPNSTGYFGPITQAAVKQWQREHGIVSSGTPAMTGYGAVGPKTRAAMLHC